MQSVHASEPSTAGPPEPRAEPRFVSERPGADGLLAEIASRARTLDERLAADANAFEADADRRPSPLDAWAAAFSDGDRQALARRLSWDSWTEAETASRLVATTPAGWQPPPWTRFLDEVLQESARLADEIESGASALGRNSEPLPFAELWEPFIRRAEAHLANRLAPECYGVFTEKARTALSAELERDLAALGVGAVHERFSTAREAAYPQGAGNGPAGRSFYRGFVLTLLRGGLGEFYLEYSVLARQLSRRCRDWVHYVSDLARRFESDREAIAHLHEKAVSDQLPDRILDLDLGLSDRHDGGRIAVLHLSPEQRVVYKPRPVALEARFADLVSTLEEKGLGVAPPAARTLERDGYGWMQYVEASEARDHRQAARYFQRAGSLLCLAYVLRADDLHWENVIAISRGPVLIDAETLLQPEIRRRWNWRAPHSVLSTQLLSSPQVDGENQRFEAGALLATGGQTAETAQTGRTFWRDVNTNAMRTCRERIEVPKAGPARSPNLLRLHGEPLRAARYREQLEDGFAQTHRFLRRHRDELLERRGPFSTLADCPVRILFRPSNAYGAVQYLLSQPRFQRTAVKTGFLIDSLNRHFNGSVEAPPLWPLTREERASLEAGDVPCFRVGSADETVRPRDGEPISGYLAKSGFDATVDLLHRLDEADLQRQLELMRQVLGQPADGRPFRTSTDAAVATRDDFSRWAREIGETMLERARSGSSGSNDWLVPAADAGEQPVLGFYGGVAGTALFLAALARASRSADLSSLAARAAGQVLERAEGLGEAELEALGLGMGGGLGGLVYALIGLHGILGSPRYAEAAIHLTYRMDEIPLRAATPVDVADGVAGAVLALLACHAATGSGRALQRADRYGDFLLEAQRPAGAGAAWANPEGAFQPGYAHGSAGIAQALLRLHRATGRSELRRAARAATTFEQGLFRPEAGNWPTEAGEAPFYMVAWCHGATGIGMSRLETAPALGRPFLERELESALATTRSAPLSSTDHICCGEMARVDFLIEAGRTLGRPHLLREAAARATAVARRARERGGYALRFATRESDETVETDYHPGLFRGMAGVGYTFLRLAEEPLGSVLRFSHDITGDWRISHRGVREEE